MVRSDAMKFASSTSLISDVASSSSKIDPIMHLATLLEDDWLPFPDINCARTFVSITLDHSDGESGKAGGRRGEGFKSSSSALTTVDNFEGSRGRMLLPSPVILNEKYKTNEECARSKRLKKSSNRQGWKSNHSIKEVSAP